MSGVKLTKAEFRALIYLSSQLVFVPGSHIPNGNGHVATGGATASTIHGLRAKRLIEFGKEPQQSIYGYRITPAGRLALSTKTTGGE